MKRWLTGIIFSACVFPLLGWGSSYEEKDKKSAVHLSDTVKNENNEVYKHADEEHQKDDEDIKRAQGDPAGRRNIHDQGAVQEESRIRW